MKKDTLRDATPNIHKKLQKCAELCDSAWEVLAEECQELETEHEKLMEEKEDLNEKLKALTTHYQVLAHCKYRLC